MSEVRLTEFRAIKKTEKGTGGARLRLQSMGCGRRMGMDRLTSHVTTKRSDGTEFTQVFCHGHRYGPAAFPEKYGTSCPHEYQMYLETIDRLAAYEDSGLTPDEIEALKQREQFLTEAYDRNAEIHKALTRDYLAAKARAEAAEKDITALARRAIDGFQDSKFITPCRWCAEREQCDLLTNGMNTCFKWRGPQEGANQ